MRRVKNNQNLPLLSLPPEIRNRIWEFALGNVVFRGRTLTVPSRKRITILRPASDETDIGVALLRCCRQIYSEAATIPLRLNTMAFDSTRQLEHAMKRFKAHQRKLITTVRLEINATSTSRAFMLFDAPRLLNTCPALKHFQVVLFNTPTEDMQVLRDCEAHLCRELNPLLIRNIRLSVERSDQQKPDPEFSHIY